MAIQSNKTGVPVQRKAGDRPTRYAHQHLRFVQDYPSATSEGSSGAVGAFDTARPATGGQTAGVPLTPAPDPPRNSRKLPVARAPQARNRHAGNGQTPTT